MTAIGCLLLLLHLLQMPRSLSSLPFEWQSECGLHAGRRDGSERETMCSDEVGGVK